MIGPFLVSAVLVALAELGDKTQLLTLVLASKYGARRVLIGVGMAILALQLIAVVAGGLVGSLIPPRVLAWFTGIVFIAFGVWTLIQRDDAGDDEHAAGTSKFRSPILAVAAAFFLAELGDKTQIMTMAIAADPAVAARPLGAFGEALLRTSPAGGVSGLIAVWLGSTVGMLAVNALAALVGTAVGTRLSPVLIRRVSGFIFIAFGFAAIGSLFMGG